MRSFPMIRWLLADGRWVGTPMLETAIRSGAIRTTQRVGRMAERLARAGADGQSVIVASAVVEGATYPTYNLPATADVTELIDANSLTTHKAVRAKLARQAAIRSAGTKALGL